MEINLTIKNENDWFKAFPPAGKEKQWADNYSAKEFARAVTDKNFEKEIKENLGFDDSFKIVEAYPERCTQFDEDHHGPRHHDLACVAEVNCKKIALGFEAKVNESLDGQLLKFDSFSDGKKERVNKLCKIFFGKEYDESLSGIYYQMLSGIAGTVAFAAEKECSDCFFIIYQLLPSKGNKVEKNTIDEHKKAITGFAKMYSKEAVNVPEELKCNDKIDLGRIELTVKEKDKIKIVGANASIVYMERQVK
ncbi:MAG: hypothetical protein MJ181_12125 [Treponema sp.]|nr:hypothetical protein [Treponema sp.]